MQTGRVFVDSNVLVYAHDKLAGEKHAIARQLLTRLWAESRGVVSPQVLLETASVLLSKFNLEHREVNRLVRAYSPWCHVKISDRLIVKALALRTEFRISIFDGLILAAAEKARACILVTEDLSHGQSYGPVKVVNPFIQGDLAA